MTTVPDPPHLRAVPSVGDPLDGEGGARSTPGVGRVRVRRDPGDYDLALAADRNRSEEETLSIAMASPGGETETASGPTGRRLAYAPGMDGLRAVAVLAVIVFHAGADWLPGGFLGVDVFFVISGFLITSLLVGEHRRRGRLAFGAFWSRRARRLLPALFLLLAVITLWALSPLPDPVQLRNFPGDAIASLFYYANWHFAAQGATYFTQFSAPSPLQHLWSLAIEEQFYLVWPLVLAAFLALGRGGRRSLLAVSLGGAAASMALMAVLYNPAHPSAVYFQTDTHAFGLLLGAAAALWVAGGDRLARACSWVAPVALLGVFACFALVDGRRAFAYQGGIGLAALLTVPVVVATTRRGPLSSTLAWRPLVWVGLISYGLYLWHWPIWTILTDARLGLDPVSATVVRAALLLAVTVASYQLLEMPIRRGALPSSSARVVAPVAVAGLAVAILAVPVAPPVYTPPVVVSGASISRAVAARELAHPPRVLLVGDSTAASAAHGFVAAAHGDYELIPAGMPPHANSYCAMDIWVSAIQDGNDGSVRVRPPSPECDWLHLFPPLVHAYDPSVVVVMFSLWDDQSHLVNGRWLQSGTPEWFAEEGAAASCAVSELSANGARVEFVLAPDTIERPGRGTDYLNAVFETLALNNPGRVGVIDARRTIESGATGYRWDGIHYTPIGSEVLASIARPSVMAALAQPRPVPVSPAACQPA